MSKLKQAIEIHLNEWAEELDKEIKEAKERGELPEKTPEQMKAEAQAIWEKARTGL